MDNIKIEIAEIDAKIIELQERKSRLLDIMTKNNPYIKLPYMTNAKDFGYWSERYICEQCPSFKRKDEKGWDLWSDILGRIEMKSGRIPNKSRNGKTVTFNQCKPKFCDYFLFVIYNTEKGTEDLFLIPSKDLEKFKPTAQHDGGAGICYNLQTTLSRAELFENYRINNWEDLEKLAGGK